MSINQTINQSQTESLLEEILLAPSNALITERFSENNQAADCVPGQCTPGVCSAA